MWGTFSDEWTGLRLQLLLALAIAVLFTAHEF
jgi:hypothetical protein